jgi:hypothetical protein
MLWGEGPAAPARPTRRTLADQRVLGGRDRPRVDPGSLNLPPTASWGRDPGATTWLLALQRLAGTAAVTGMLDREHGTIQRQNVRPKAPTKFTGTAGDLQTFLEPGGGPFTIQLMSLTDDIIGHAWVGVKRKDGKSRTIGFWPNALYSGLLGPGKIFMPDPHAGEEMHEYEQQVPYDKIYKLLGVVSQWQSSMYSLLGHHCATFAHEAYTTVTGENFDAMWDDSVVVWTPATLGSSIDERKKLEAAVRAKGGTPGPQSSNRPTGVGPEAVTEATELDTSAAPPGPELDEEDEGVEQAA